MPAHNDVGLCIYRAQAAHHECGLHHQMNLYSVFAIPYCVFVFSCFLLENTSSIHQICHSFWHTWETFPWNRCFQDSFPRTYERHPLYVTVKGGIVCISLLKFKHTPQLPVFTTLHMKFGWLLYICLSSEPLYDWSTCMTSIYMKSEQLPYGQK